MGVWHRRSVAFDFGFFLHCASGFSQESLYRLLRTLSLCLEMPSCAIIAIHLVNDFDWLLSLIASEWNLHVVTGAFCLSLDHT